jgi:hypothetical protein
MKSLKRKLVIGICLVCSGVMSLNLVGQETSFNVLDLMSDAKPLKATYRVDMTIDTSYKVVNVKPYLYSKTSGDIVELDEQQDIFYNAANFTFQRSPQEQEFLVLHVQYGPSFVFNRDSEAICIAPVQAFKVVEDIQCDSYTTTRYLIARSEFPTTDDDLFSADILNRMLEFDDMKDNQSWHNYQAIIAFTLNHFSEKPEYLEVSLAGNYLRSMVKFSNSLRTLMIDKRRFSLGHYQDALAIIDPSIVNIGYLMLSSLSSKTLQHQNNYPYVFSHPTYVEDFFAGISPFRLTEPESMSLDHVELMNNKINFHVWPWFDHVKYSFGDKVVKKAVDGFIEVPEDTDVVYLRPYSQSGKFLRTIVQVSQEKLLEPTQASKVGD